MLSRWNKHLTPVSSFTGMKPCFQFLVKTLELQILLEIMFGLGVEIGVWEATSGER